MGLSNVLGKYDVYVEYVVCETAGELSCLSDGCCRIAKYRDSLPGLAIRQLLVTQLGKASWAHVICSCVFASARDSDPRHRDSLP
jgi:hypothetical protein